MISVPKYQTYRREERVFSAGSLRGTLAVSVLAVFFLVASLEAKAEARTIRIVAGTYGQNCGAPHGNITHDVAHRCNGLTTCRYSPRVMRKDRLAAACSNDFVAEWRCDGADFHTAALSPEAKLGDVLVLGCGSARGAGK